MKCTKCGAEIQPGFKFCISCGQPVAVVQQQSANRPTPMRPVAQPQRPTAQPISTGNKGLGTFFRGGMQAIRNERKREERAAAEQQINRLAEQYGYEISKPNPHAGSTQQNVRQQAPAQPQNQPRQIQIEGVDMVRGRAIWNIGQGQIARKISERELEEVEKLKGIIVQEGCSALIFANGQLTTTLSSGAYLFYKSMEEEQAALKAAMEKAEKEMQQRELLSKKQEQKEQPTFRQLGIVGSIGKMGQWVSRLVFGEKQGEQKEKIERRKLDYARILGQITQAPILSVYLISERSIPLVFNGETDSEGSFEFLPFRIPTKLVDIDIAVTMQLRITDIHLFATNYLADRNTATTLQFQQILKPVVEATLKQMVRNLDYERSGLPAPVIENIKNRLQNEINQHLYGITCEKVLQITDSSADFERFRSVEHELYCSEQELGYLQRTGEFHNRLAQETNSQAINQANNAEALRYALQDINKDKLLHEDEMDQFVLMLGAQKRLREAKSKEEEYEALSDLKKSRLVKDDELAKLEDALEHNKIQRESITEVMRINAQLSIDEARMKNEFALDDKRQEHDFASQMRSAQHGQQMAEIDMQNRQRENDFNFAERQRQDKYNWEQQQRQNEYDWQRQQRERAMQREDESINYARTRQDRQDELEALERKARIAQQNMATMQAHDEQMAAMQHQTEQMRINAQTQMSAEQIAASQITGMDAAAQAELSKSLGSGKENELLKQQQAQQAALYQQMLQMQQNQGMQSQQQMMEMARMMQQGMMGMGQQQQAFQQQRYEDQLQRAEEYRQDAQRQQSRVDNVAQQAMDYTTRAHQTDSQSFAQAMGNVQQSQPQPQNMLYCPNCGGEVAENATSCPHCGQQFG